MHLSALSPTTRVTHAERHGWVGTVEQERAWFAEGANRINCKCSPSEMLLNEDGTPMFPDVVKRTQDARANFVDVASKGKG